MSQPDDGPHAAHEERERPSHDGREAEPLDHLFRRESGRMTSALTRLFGLHNLPLVQDVVNDALCRALEVWKYRGLPDNPSAWLMAAARNRAIDVLRRERTARTFAPDLTALLSTEWTLVPTVGELFGEEALRDEQLRMMFACCHARLPEETQVALILNLLGGFSMSEVAAAFLVSEAALEKRLQRGKHTLADAWAESPGKQARLPEVTPDRLEAALPAVHSALYLLFNEGYHGANPEKSVRAELCGEAIRLASLLAESPVTATPETHALLALMCLCAARLPGRVGPDGELLSWSAQDRTLWDRRLIDRGLAALEASATGEKLTAFHLEAAIAYEHTSAASLAETRFARIVGLYDVLMKLRPSPVVALSRAIAIGQSEGPERALEEIARIPDAAKLASYPFFAAAIGEEELRAGHDDCARSSFQRALTLARNPAESKFLTSRIAACESGLPRRR
jgi:RNA polymerase sigma-70 factor (ECF subfamily)